METGIARIDGARLYYEVSGEGHPLVLLHDGLLDRRIWDEQFGVFSRRFRTVRYDRRGHGRSESPDGEFSHVDDLHALLDFLGVGRAHLVGASNGGRISVDFALAYPGMVCSLVLVGSALSGYPMSEERRRSVSEIFSVAREGNAEKWADAWLDDPYWAPSRGRTVARRKLRTLLARSLRDFLRSPHENRIISAVPRLSEIGAPTLVIVGGRDSSDNQAIASTLESGIPGAEKVVASGAAHMVNVEEPEKFNRLVLRFLERCEAKRKR